MVINFINEFFKQFNLKIFKAEKISTHGGSIRIYLRKNQNAKEDKNLKIILKEEEKFGIKNLETYKKFGEKVYKIRENVLKNINKLKDKKSIIGYGVTCKSNNRIKFFWYFKPNRLYS